MSEGARERENEKQFDVLHLLQKGDTATFVKQDKDNYTFIYPFSNPRNAHKINS